MPGFPGPRQCRDYNERQASWLAGLLVYQFEYHQGQVVADLPLIVVDKAFSARYNPYDINHTERAWR